MRTKLKNMGHAALARNGNSLSRSAFASKASRERLLKRDDLAPADALIMQAALQQIEELDREVEALGAEIVRVGKTLAGVRRLLQVHGMNLLSAISLLAEIGDIALFETSKQLTAYAGPATSTRQSNETTRHGGITKRGRKRLRTVAISAVLSMVSRTKTPLMGFYQKKKREKGSGKAICATARKLRGAWLDHAQLQDADLREAHLTIAKLTGADLTGADLRGAQLNNAILRSAKLLKVDFSGAILRGADFNGAVLGWTVFGYTDIHSALNLDSVRVESPISIGLDTMQLSRWRVPRKLLSNPKLHPDVIATVERWAGKAEVYYSCFLSHSSSDKEFAGKLYDELRTDGVACWYSAEDLPPGAIWRDELRESLKSAERVLVLVTSYSLHSAGVLDEMNEVLNPGHATSKIVPLKLLEAVS
jgi:hypothetical protein